MLVLSRRLGEEVVIPDLNITVKIVGLKSGRVQLGIDAPREVDVTRPDICRGRSTAAGGRDLDVGPAVH